MAVPSMRGRAPQAARGRGTGRVLAHTHPNATLFGVLLCLPTAPGLPLWRNGDFGTSPIFGQLSDKPLLASIWLRGVSDVKNNGGLRNYALI
jgi:hypothetical protein